MNDSEIKLRVGLFKHLMLLSRLVNFMKEQFLLQLCKNNHTYSTGDFYCSVWDYLVIDDIHSCDE